LWLRLRQDLRSSRDARAGRFYIHGYIRLYIRGYIRLYIHGYIRGYIRGACA